jgi:uncharacterized alkaline shock family protein YloU
LREEATYLVVEMVVDNRVPKDIKGVKSILKSNIKNMNGVSVKEIRIRVLERVKKDIEELEKEMAIEKEGRVDVKLDERQVVLFFFSKIGLSSFHLKQ